MQQILFFKIGAIGDALMTTPLLRQVKKTGATIGYCIGKRSAVILQGNKSVDEVFTFDESIFEKKSIKNVFRMFGLIAKLTSLRTQHHYKTIVVLDRHWIFGLVAKLAGFKKRVGLDRLGKDGKFLTHKILWDAKGREVEHYLNLGQYVGTKPDLDDQIYEYELTENKKVDAELAQVIPQWKQTCIGIALGGGNQISKSIHGTGDCRRRSLNKWEELIQRLLEDGYNVVAFGGPTDRKLDIRHTAFNDMTGKFSLRETIYGISMMNALICQESGFMHFGACAGTPVIALAGPTDPHRLYPFINRKEPYPGEWIWKMPFECYDAYGSFEKCNGDEIDKITVDEVYAVTQKYL